MDDIIPIRLKLPGTKIIKVEEDSREDLIIYVETTEEGVNCKLCGKLITKFHSADREIKLRHLSVLESDTYIIYKPHRYIMDYRDIDSCKIFSFRRIREPRITEFKENILRLRQQLTATPAPHTP